MKHKYGNFTSLQFDSMKQNLQKQIFFLLLCADPKTKGEYSHINLNDAFEGLLHRINGLNSVMGFPKEIVDIVSLLEEARIIYNKSSFDYKTYRRLILGAGALSNSIKEV